MMKHIWYLSLLLSICCVMCTVNAAPYAGARAVENNYNMLSGRPCIQECQARCGGICYLNMMAFKYICSCARMGK